jgi:DnaK suppressor protein
MEQKAYDKRKKMLEEMLLSKRKELKQQIESHMDAQADTPVGNAVLDVGDQSVQNHETDLDLSLLEMKNQVLKEIEEAIIKLGEDRYGVCEQCGNEISPARLKAVPFARYCIACKEQQELLEKVDKSRTEL